MWNIMESITKHSAVILQCKHNVYETSIMHFRTVQKKNH